MNNLAYSTQDIDKVGNNVEEILRKDLGADKPVAYSVSLPEADTDSLLTSFAKGLSVAIFGGKEKVLCKFLFEIPAPRPVQLLMVINKMGIGCHAGSLVFSTHINKMVAGKINMEGPKTFGSSKFIGDETTAKKLNGNKDLLKLTEKFARTKSDVGGGLKLERFVNLEPDETGAVLTIVTLPRAYSMGLKATTDAADFMAIAEMMERTL